MKTIKIRRILFIGSYPPPFGGIASHLSDLFTIYEKEESDFYVFDVNRRDLHKDEGLLHLRFPKPSRGILSRFSAILFLLRHINRFTLIFFKSISFCGKKREKIIFPFVVVSTLVDLLKTIQKENISVLSVYHVFPEGLYAYYIKKYFINDIQYAVTVFGELQADTIHLSKHGGLYKQLLMSADTLMASSQYCGRGVERIGISFKRVRVIPYGIDINHFRRTVPYEQTRLNQTILFVGHINERMGLKCLLDAVAILKEKGIEPKVLIVGNDHGYLSEFTTLIHSYGLVKNIEIKNDVSYEALNTIYNKSYLYVNAANTRLPCMGLSMKEAMATELPVIASNAGGIPEAIVAGETGFIFSTDDASELAGYVEILLADFELAKKMGQFGRLRAEQIFDKNKSSQQIFNLLNSRAE